MNETNANVRAEAEYLRSLVRIGQYLRSHISDEALCTRVGDIFAETVGAEVLRISKLTAVVKESNNVKLTAAIYSSALQFSPKLASAALDYCRGSAPTRCISLHKTDAVFVGVVVGIFGGMLRAESLPPWKEFAETLEYVFFSRSTPPFVCRFDYETWSWGQLTNIAAEMRQKRPELLRVILEPFHRYLYKTGEEAGPKNWLDLPVSTQQIMSLFTDQLYQFAHPSARLHYVLGKPKVWA